MFFKNVLRVGSITLGSRVLGLIRDTLMAVFMGASALSDAFLIAFKLPNTFRRLFAEGSLNSVFVPIYASLCYNDRAEARRFANEIFTRLLLIIILVIVLMEIFMPQVMVVLAPGFKKIHPVQYLHAITLTRITLAYLLFMSLASLYAAILNSFKKFAVVAALPIVLNICIISALLIHYYITTRYDAAYYACVGIALAGFLQFFILFLYLHKLKLLPKFRLFPKLTVHGKSFFKNVLPAVVSAGTYQLNIFVDLTVASWLSTGSITCLYYADRLTQLPLAMIGIAMSTVLVPYISSRMQDKQEVASIKRNSILYSTLLSIAAAALFLVMGKEILTMLFNYGRFSMEGVVKTYGVLCFYAVAIIPNVLLKIIVSIFYAERDVKLPFYTNLLVLVINIVLCVLLPRYMGAKGIACATCISCSIGVIIMFNILVKRRYLIVLPSFLNELFKGMMAICIVFLLIYVAKYLIFNYVDATNRITFIVITLSTCVVSAFLCLFALKVVKSSLYSELKDTFTRKNT